MLWQTTLTIGGLWIGPTLGALTAAAGGFKLGWFSPVTRKHRLQHERIAEHLAAKNSLGYDYLFPRCLEHFQGGRPWTDEWDKANTPINNGRGAMYDARGPALTWKQRMFRKLVS